jgi:ribonuclease-3
LSVPREHRDRTVPPKTPHQAQVAELESALGYTFRDRQQLLRALTHPSCPQPPAGQSNQRLEFLGDATLGFVIAAELYRRFPEESEGRLTELRATLVCEEALARQARRLRLGRYLIMDKGQLLQKGAENPSILADAYEAVIGAVYLDGGLRAARRVIVRQLLVRWHPQTAPALTRNEKSLLLEKAQTRGLQPHYRLVFEGGPEHRKVFAVRVLLGRKVVGQGWGFRKRDAERMAAREALRSMGLLIDTSSPRGEGTDGLFSHRRAEDDSILGPRDRRGTGQTGSGRA